MMFADDTKLYSRVDTSQNMLQSNLEALVRWSETRQMPFNKKKCKVLHLRRSNPNCSYVIEGTELKTVQVEKELSIQIDQDLKFR